MKKIAILIPLFMLILQATFAQNQKGDQTLGLSLGFFTSSSNYSYQTISPGTLDLTSTRSTGFGTSPTYSYFIANNLDLGASIGFSNYIENLSDPNSPFSSKQINRSYTGSIYLRKYFLYNNKVGIRMGPYFTYQYTNANVTYAPDANLANNNFKGKFYGGGLDADFVYYPVSRVGLAVNLGSLSYNHNNTSNTLRQTSGSNSLALQFLNNNLMLSAFYIFH